ncbi:hypothetical protein NQZ68_012585 [Dissostichus eleginoides]|nr:hypothetical protein NQZ68_012585 [Dissostichus eleginoides]
MESIPPDVFVFLQRVPPVPGVGEEHGGFKNKALARVQVAPVCGCRVPEFFSESSRMWLWFCPAAEAASGPLEQLSAGSGDWKKESRPAPNFTRLLPLQGLKGGWAPTQRYTTWTNHEQFLSISL